ncbi:TMEM165/GDT1 family protein [Candidatus Woesearchaeota archaeon]|nr:TMEM165/GDT1 family protein [Candidatus Woesearchaeota archaeon]
MFQDFFVPMLAMALAEIGDKTQLAMLALAMRHRHVFHIFAGAMAASALVDGSAVVLGTFVASYFEHSFISVFSGFLFVFFGLWMFFRREKEDNKHLQLGRRSVLFAAFALFFVSEFGDKSQFAALLFGVRYDLLFAVLGSLAGIAVVLSVMLAFGRFIGSRVDERLVRLGASVLFVAVGFFTVAEALLR